MNMSIHEDTHMKSQFHGTVLANTPLCFITKKIKQIFFFFSLNSGNFLFCSLHISLYEVCAHHVFTLVGLI